MELIKKEVKETYTYNPGGNGNEHEIVIIFVDGKFKKVEYNFTGTYSREEWRILAEIESEISRIEKEKDV